MVELENAVADKSSTSKLIKVKDQKISLLQQTVDDKEQRILEVENQ